MTPRAKRSVVPIAMVTGSAAVLVLLAVLQYRWSLEISRAERTRIETSLSNSVSQFRQEFYRELAQVPAAFRGDPAASPDDFWSNYADRYQDWVRTAARPDLVANVFVWQAAGARLRQLALADGQFQPVDWPASLAKLEANITAEAHQIPGPGAPPDGGPPEIRTFAWTLEERIPALVHPVFTFGGSNSGRPPWRRGARGTAESGPPPPMMDRVLLGFVIVELNRAALDHMLGELAQRYFAGPDGFIYNVLVVSGAPDNQVVYRSDPQLNPSSLNPPDAHAALVPATPGESRAIENAAAPRVPSGGRKRGANGSGRGQFAARNRGDLMLRNRNAMILPSAAESPWQLLARHKGGSLEAVVTADRRRNLLLSFGVLTLLAVSMALLIVSAQRARRLARLQMEFVAGVSHELRTPVAVICSAADNLAEGFVGGKDQVREYGAVIRNEGRRLAAMIEEILRFASGQSRRPTYELAPVTIADVVSRVAATVAALPEAEGFTIERQIDPDLPQAQADDVALTHCLENLVMNALKYGGEARWVRVSASRGPEHRVRIAVEDRGDGIDPADLPHLFEPFYRGKQAKAAQIRGAGLGLSLARDIAEGMGGHLEAANREGGGSVFTLELNAAVSTPATVAGIV